eukprot:1137056-Pelagomonas_calceolata.AAC.8
MRAYSRWRSGGRACWCAILYWPAVALTTAGGCGRMPVSPGALVGAHGAGVLPHGPAVPHAGPHTYPLRSVHGCVGGDGTLAVGVP